MTEIAKLRAEVEQLRALLREANRSVVFEMERQSGPKQAALKTRRYLIDCLLSGEAP